LDVVNYRHVPQGPGVMLISHEVNYAMDHAEGRFGLLAQRKLGRAAHLPAAVAELVRLSLEFADLLENDLRVEGALKFEAGAFEFAANDRLAAPNTDAAFAALLPQVQAAAESIYPGRGATVTRVANDPRERLALRVDSGQSLEIDDVIDAVEALEQ
ncbi:MAG: hypothetical protein D6768_15895, partial [Chloroflexi bacterium]